MPNQKRLPHIVRTLAGPLSAGATGLWRMDGLVLRGNYCVLLTAPDGAAYSVSLRRFLQMVATRTWSTPPNELEAAVETCWFWLQKGSVSSRRSDPAVPPTLPVLQVLTGQHQVAANDKHVLAISLSS
jgi:hypothetical protein